MAELQVSLPVSELCLWCVQPDDEEGRYEQEGDEGEVSFIAHVPVPSQKEVSNLLTSWGVLHVGTLSCGCSAAACRPSCLTCVCVWLPGGGGPGSQEEDGAVAAICQRSSSGSESNCQNTAGTLTRPSAPPSVCLWYRHEQKGPTK